MAVIKAPRFMPFLHMLPLSNTTARVCHRKYTLTHFLTQVVVENESMAFWIIISPLQINYGEEFIIIPAAAVARTIALNTFQEQAPSAVLLRAAGPRGRGRGRWQITYVRGTRTHNTKTILRELWILFKLHNMGPTISIALLVYIN